MIPSDMLATDGRRIVTAVIVFVALGAPAMAQPSAAPAEGTSSCDRREVIQSRDWHCVGHVELEMQGTQLFADEVWFYAEEHRAVLSGNVLFTQGYNRISADRAEIDTNTRLGVFHNAWGIASLQQSRQPAVAGVAAAPQLTGEDTDVYFFGDTVEKIGPKKYKISNGGFTTCVQPSPRWDLHAGTVVLNIDSYTLLRDAVFNVKGVPLLYVPFLYYPTKEDNRATGFLLPTYGSSSLRGRTLSNAFFWAIDRSQDATFMHDWYSKAGQGWGGEYRYAAASGDGNIRSYVIDESIEGQPSSGRAFEVRGGLTQRLPAGLRARARVDYFSDLSTMQSFSTNVLESTRNRRTYGGNVAGSWGIYSLNATFDRSDYFSSDSSSSGTTSSLVTRTGPTPRIALTRSERPLYSGSPLYFSATTEVARLERKTDNNGTVVDSGLSRFDFHPQVRYPFKRWQWFTVNSVVTWRDTFYTRSVIPANSVSSDERFVENDLNRRYFTVSANAVGPVFNRVWDTPGNGYAERFKHAIEPFFNVQRTSFIENYPNIIRTDSVDAVVGTTTYDYGINNRFYAKRRLGTTTQAQEIVSVELRQSYYTNALAASLDQEYSGYNLPPSEFSPLLLTVRATPSATLNATFRAEFDSKHRELRTASASAGYNWTTRVQTTVGWSQRYFIEALPPFNDPAYLNHYVNVETRARTADNRVGLNYSINYDVLNARMLQQRVTTFYNAQCCGIAAEYQTHGLPTSVSSTPYDHRFFVSFSLAGLGNFSPFSGVMGSVPR